LLFSSNSFATTNHFQAFDVWPEVGDRYFLTIPSSQGLYQNQYAFELSNSFIYRSLDLLNSAGTARVGSIISYAFAHFISAGFGITDFWQAGLILPIFSQARFTDPIVTPTPAAVNIMRVGDLKFTTKLRVINNVQHRWGLAFEPFVTIPLKGDQKFLGEGKVTGGVKAIGDFLITEKIRAALFAGVQFQRDQVLVSNIDYQHRLLGGLGFSGDVRKGMTLAIESQASAALNHFSNQNLIPLEIVGDASWDIGDSGFKMSAGGGTCLLCGTRAAHVRGFLNIGYRRVSVNYKSKKKAEEKMTLVTLGKITENQLLAEQIVELKEKCPANPAEYNPQIHDPACLRYFKIKESIVILTGPTSNAKFTEVFLKLKKNCPADPKDFDPEKHDAGCPKYFALKEEIVSLTGEQGEEKFTEVFLKLKKNCPADPKDFDPEKHDASCPKYFELNKKILPLMAKTDEEREVVEYILQGGNRDGDGISENSITFTKGEVRTLAPVHFAFDKVDLTPKAKSILNDLSDALIRHSEIHKLEIVGHADPIGTLEANQRISLKRAQVVSEYLMLRGVPEELKLVPMGVGDKQPVAPNNTPQGRRENRRVEFLTK